MVDGRKRKVVILFYSGTGLISRAIRWQTRSKWSHVAFLFEKTVIEAVSRRGVIKRELCEEDRKATRRVIECSEKQYYLLLRWCNQQVGLRYDYVAILRFLDRRNSVDNNRWFCSEFVGAGLAENVQPVLAETAAWEYSPGLLARSTLLAYEAWPEEQVVASQSSNQI